MSRNTVLTEFYKKLPDIEQHVSLIVYIKTDTNNINYNSNYARELIGTNIRDFFQRTTLLQKFPTTEISQSELLFDFSQWVHMTVDEEIKKNVQIIMLQIQFQIIIRMSLIMITCPTRDI